MSEHRECDKNILISEEDTSTKRNLLLVGGCADTLSPSRVWTKQSTRSFTTCSWVGGVFFMLPCTQLLLQWTDTFVGGTLMTVSRRISVMDDLSVMENFSGGQGFEQDEDTVWDFVDTEGSKQVTVYCIIFLGNHTDAIVTNNFECTLSFWWRGQGRHSWFFHPRNAQTSSRNLDNNISWRCYRQKHRTTPRLDQEIRVRYIQTDLNFADSFTKSLTPKKHTEGVKAVLGDKDVIG